jgi:hypothetical protein
MHDLSNRCENGCCQGFTRVEMPGEDYDKFLCTNCGEEIFFTLSISFCKCGSMEYKVCPMRGQSVDKGYLLQCSKCCEYITIDSLYNLAKSIIGN